MILVLVCTLFVITVSILQNLNYTRIGNVLIVLLGSIGFFLEYEQNFVGFIEIVAYLAIVMNITSLSKELKVLLSLLPIALLLSPFEGVNCSFLLNAVSLSLIFSEKPNSMYLILGLFLCVSIYSNSILTCAFIGLTYVLLLSNKNLNKELLLFATIPMVSHIQEMHLYYLYVVSTVMIVASFFTELSNRDSRYLLMSTVLYMFFGMKTFWIFLMVVVLEQIMFEVIKRVEDKELYIRDLLRPQFYHLSVVYFLMHVINISTTLYIAFLVLYSLFALRATSKFNHLDIVASKTYIISPIVLMIASGLFYNAEYSMFGFLKIIKIGLVPSTIELLAILILPVIVFLCKKFLSQQIENIFLKYEIKGQRRTFHVDLSLMLQKLNTQNKIKVPSSILRRGITNIMKDIDQVILYLLCLVTCFLILRMVLL